MPIQVECPSCHVSMKVPDEHAGRRGRCPSCKAVFVATAKVGAPASSDHVGLAPPDPPRPSPRPTAAVVDDDDGGSYDLADTPGRGRNRTVRARTGSLPGVGVGARGVFEAAAPTRRTLMARDILNAFGSHIEPVRPTLLYRAWIVIVAAVMLMLPLVYLAIVGLVAMATFYHAVHNVWIFQGVRGSAALKVAALAYAAPMMAGGIVVLLMIKPLFAKPARDPKSQALEPGSEPLLHAFVEGVCDAVGSPRPAKVVVDCRVNASAHREGGLLGVLGGKLVLTIGMPFVAGVSLQQFAGVLAHEFGHFSQGAGMRLFVLIMRVNMWFARLVYQRDEWDQNLQAWTSSDNGALILFGLVAKLAVWLTRRVLWVLMTVGHIASGFLSRQMEYDADRYEARMVGAGCFIETMWRFRLMSMAEQGAFADLTSSWQQRRLPDNFPKLVIANIPQIPEQVVEALKKDMQTAPTKLFTTHPADKDRIARAQREAPDEGIFTLQGPATDVFRDFDMLAKAASFAMYRAALGRDITLDQLYEVAELVETQASAQEGAVAAGRFFLGVLDSSRRLAFPEEYPRAPADLPAAGRALAASRRSLQSARAAYQASSERVRELRMRLMKAEAAVALLKAGVKVRASDYDLPNPTLQGAEGAREMAEDGLRRIAEADASHPFAAAAVARLAGALGLLEHEKVAGRVDEGRDRREEARGLFRCTAHLCATVMPQLDRLARAQAVLSTVLDVYTSGNDPKNQAKINAVLRAASDLRDRLEETEWKVGNAVVYPFEHAIEHVTLGRFAFPAPVPSKEDVGALLEISGEVIDRLARLHNRALGRLALAAEEVERALNLPPIAVEDAEPVVTAEPA